MQRFQKRTLNEINALQCQSSSRYFAWKNIGKKLGKTCEKNKESSYFLLLRFGYGCKVWYWVQWAPGLKTVTLLKRVCL